MLLLLCIVFFTIAFLVVTEINRVASLSVLHNNLKGLSYFGLQ